MDDTCRSAPPVCAFLRATHHWRRYGSTAEVNFAKPSGAVQCSESLDGPRLLWSITTPCGIACRRSCPSATCNVVTHTMQQHATCNVHHSTCNLTCNVVTYTMHRVTCLQHTPCSMQHACCCSYPSAPFIDACEQKPQCAPRVEVLPLSLHRTARQCRHNLCKRCRSAERTAACWSKSCAPALCSMLRCAIAACHQADPLQATC